MRYLWLVLGVAGIGCSSVERAAARDPMKCEQDPDCENRAAKSHDCSTACADNIDCMRRCEEVRGHR